MPPGFLSNHIILIPFRFFTERIGKMGSVVHNGDGTWDSSDVPEARRLLTNGTSTAPSSRRTKPSSFSRRVLLARSDGLWLGRMKCSGLYHLTTIGKTYSHESQGIFIYLGSPHYLGRRVIAEINLVGIYPSAFGPVPTVAI